MHDAWSYFAAQYGLDLAATYEPQEGQQPSLADLAHLQQVIKQDDITTFYTEPEKRSPGITEVFQNEFGLTIKILDPIGGVGTRDSYLNMMRENFRALGAAL